MSAVIKLAALDVRRLAADFSHEVRTAHTSSQLRNIVKRNAGETDASVDHVNDYYDANDLMADAVTRQLGSEWSWGDVADDINMAWGKAKASGYSLSRILVACEFSGTVRDAFAAKGHSVISCDLLATETPGAHYQGSVFDIINDGFDTMIAHPPCTYLAASQLWRCQEKHDKNYPERQLKSDESLEFVRELFAAPIGRKCIENPKSRIGTAIKPATQMVQPHEYGHDASKQTFLWLEELPKLTADIRDYVSPRMVEYRGKLVKRWANQSPCGADNKAPGPDRWKLRSKTFSGIAQAMAEQWCQPLTA